MQDDSGLKKILTLSWAYNLFKRAVGTRRAYEWMGREFWLLQPGQKVLDIGCGPATLLDHVQFPPGVKYVGFDISEAYVEHARQRWAHDPDKQFVVGVAEDFIAAMPPQMAGADLVLMNGLLHHLDDGEAKTALQLARKALAPDGRLVCLEGCFLVRHEPIDHWLVSRDRGRNVRSEPEWKRLVASVFDHFETYVLTGLLRIPYTHIAIVARR